MNKGDFINEWAQRLNIPRYQCMILLNTALDIISEELTKENDLIIQNFGTLSIWKQAPREGRNPRTGDSCMIPPRISVKFRPGKALLEKLNKDK